MQCPSNKRTYRKRQAATLVNAIWRAGRGRMRKYQCELCNYWHLTHYLRVPEFITLRHVPIPPELNTEPFEPMPKKPIHLAPRVAFKKRLKAEIDPQLIIKELRFVQYSKTAFTAEFKQGRKGRTHSPEMQIGPMVSLAAIEERVIKALKIGGTL